MAMTYTFSFRNLPYNVFSTKYYNEMKTLYPFW